MTDEEKIIARILNVIPPSSFELTTFLSLFRVRFSDNTETACVTCSNSPELLLNQTFIETYCKSDEHLVMLIMHELYHVILGHTTLFPHATPILNIIFDAVINAILCSLFPSPEYTSFFTNYYPADLMPYALLRPKGNGTPKEAEFALKLLYDGSNAGTYYDVYEALLKNDCVLKLSINQNGKPILIGSSCNDNESSDNHKNNSEANHGASPQDSEDIQKQGTSNKPLLLGSHSENSEDLSQEMKDLLHEIISKWPSPDRPLQGRDMGSNVRERDYDADAAPQHALRRGVRQLMQRADLHGPKELRRRSICKQIAETASFLPDWRDRSHEARELTLKDALLYRSYISMPHLTSRDNKQAFVYFDVSGSVANEVPTVAQALLPYCKRGLCSVHVFSTVVHPASAAALAAHKFVSSGGTDINCVLKHVLDLPLKKRPRFVIVITDGFTGCPDTQLRDRFRASKMKLYVGLIQSNEANDPQNDLTSITEKYINLY
ncbi:MAG: hypothetical protein IJ165_04110 [Proteobacteria bacterium]|nr:hypothetical protein [Pseudomonadota bacterium]